MRYHCNMCGKSVTSELPDGSVIRAILVCPECIQAKRIIFPEDEEKNG
jgi:DNA-directed RNA polymerase subunit RPC12/RpoP